MVIYKQNKNKHRRFWKISGRTSGSCVGEGPEGVADTGDIVHIDVVEFGQLDEALDRDAHFALFVVGIGGLGDVDGPRDLRLVEVMIAAQCLDAFCV